jgi:hypothetical protein
MTNPEIDKVIAAAKAEESKVKAFFRQHLTWIIAGACFVAWIFVGHYR